MGFLGSITFLLFDVTKYSIYYLTEIYQIGINVDGKKKKNYTRVGHIALEKEVSRNLYKIIKDFDPKFKSRSKMVGWDVGLEYDCSHDDELCISMYDLFFSINDYYNNNCITMLLFYYEMYDVKIEI